MTNRSLTFEHPLNERIRTFLRADYLFQLIRYRFNHAQSSWDAKDCIVTIIELFGLIERTEFKSELLKELERHINSLQRLSKAATIDRQALNNILNNLENASDALRAFFEKQAFHPKDNELFNSVRQRLSIPGGTCSFDLPAFHYWLQQPFKSRQHYLSYCVTNLEPLEKALSLVLDLIRKSSLPTQEATRNGTFQKTLSKQGICQLVQVTLPASANVYPEISGNKHRINIRLMLANFELGKPMLAAQDLPFELTCCTM